MASRARGSLTSDRWRRTVRVVGCALPLLLGPSASAQAQRRLPEADIHAAFILKFPAFVTWSRSPGDTLHIAVVEGEELLAALGRLAEQHNATPADGLLPGVPPVVTVAALGRSGDPRPFHILVLAGPHAGPVNDLIARAHQAGAVTVDCRPEPGAGTMIKLRRDVNRLRFDVDLEAARAAGIKVSSRLLQLARGDRGHMLLHARRARLC